eukprot:TRINITY_DN10669_c0_g1_i1.p1 TRINITY_DN10669_c0_g1~~TRINITY_DN10669_c0_g1_i1.p1  ORF type:complete len:318 (+),score=51.70 TRINITY_DN10669_c0_g1_i1:78-1031(+)
MTARIAHERKRSHSWSNWLMTLLCSSFLVFAAFYDPDSPQIHRVGGYLQKQTGSWLTWSQNEQHQPSSREVAALEQESLHVNYSEAVSFHDTEAKEAAENQDRRRPLCWRKPRDVASCPDKFGVRSVPIRYYHWPVSLAKKLHHVSAVLTFEQCRPAPDTQWLVQFPQRSSVHMDLLTVCNINTLQEQRLTTLMESVQWPVLNISFDRVVCGSNTTTKASVPLLLLADRRSQLQLAGFAARLAQRIQHALKIDATSIMSSRNTWHVPIGNVDIKSCSIRKLLGNIGSLFPSHNWVGAKRGARVAVQQAQCPRGYCNR